MVQPIALPRAKREGALSTDVKPTDVGAAEPTELVPQGAAKSSRWGVWAILIGFGAFIAWAATAPLNEGVPAVGMVVVDTKRKPVQHQSGGTIKEVLVREGQSVKEGQLIARMEGTMVQANFDATRQRYLGLLAMQGRLQAERAGSATINWHPDLRAASTDPEIRMHMMNQEQLMATRRSLLASDLRSIDESIQGLEGQLQAFTSIATSRRQQLALINEELTQTRSLVAEGYAPRNRVLELERSVADIQSSLADLQGNTVRSQASIRELRQRATSRTTELRREVDTMLADVSRDVSTEVERLKSAQSELTRIDIKSPADGQVVGLMVQAAGAVVGPGQKLMDIVPKDEKLLLEAHIPPNHIDRVKPKTPVDIRFAGFANTPQLLVHGEILSVSNDLIQEPGSPNPPYYLARVVLTEQGVRELGHHVLQPGMPVEVVFKTGERSMLEYMLHPLTKRLAASMTEE